MPRLKKFFLGCFHIEDSDIAAFSFPPNYSVKTLPLKIVGDNINVLQIFLEAFPKIEILKIHFFDDDVADLIAKTPKSLKHLIVRSFHVKNIAKDLLLRNSV